MRTSIVALLLVGALPALASAQLSDAELSARMGAAEANPSVSNLLSATDAALNMRDYGAAEAYLDEAWQAAGPMFNGLVNLSIVRPLASGEGVVAAQRAFRQVNEVFHFSPIQISTIAGNFPELLASGEYDEMMLRLSPDATDPQYRCACLNTKAWVHRLAGRHDEARELWAILVEGQIEQVERAPNRNAQAQIRGQYARNLARAGQHDEARRQLQISMDTEVDAAALPSIRRRWAQTYAELGDVPGAVEHLEALLDVNSTITVQALESRAAWALVRDDPAFQAMLDRHR